jgi:glycosyltransferase involved in cell wall biosynthesis
LEAKPTALFLAPESPYPTAGGGALRSAALLEYLASRYQLDVVVFRQPGGPDPAETRLRDLAHRVGVIDLPFHPRNTAARAVRNLDRFWRGVSPLTDRFSGFEEKLAGFLRGRHYELSLIEHFWCAGYRNLLQRHSKRVILDLHNIESVLHGRCAATERWPFSMAHRRFRRACRKLERDWLPEFSFLLAASEKDASTVREIAPGSRPVVYPNTIPALPAPDREEQHVIAFSANMEYHPNIGAVRFFRERIWPLLREEWPGLVWALIGKNPEAVRRYVDGDPRIRLTGPVTDAVAALAEAKVALVPLLAGSGTRIKILEAWAAGTPVVSTTVGAEGLPATHGEHLLIADTPAAFARATSSLLASAALRKKMGEASRSLYEKEFTWKAGWAKLADLGI